MLDALRSNVCYCMLQLSGFLSSRNVVITRNALFLLCPFLARIRLPALELPAMAQQVANRMLEDHLRVVSRTPAHRE
jgi:hypothetical protein